MENSDWCKQIKFHLGVLDLDVALYFEKPTVITEASSDEEKSYYKYWDRSNRLGLMFMRMNIAGNIKTTLPKTESAKELLKIVEESFQTADKSLAGTLMVGSLMYAQICTRPDISFAVGMLGRYQSNPGMDHWKAAKKVLRYLQETKDHMLTYRRSDNLDAIGYLDSNYADCVDTRKSTFGYLFLLGGGSISWKSAK
ncbi:secreted RxLR effector protein 161-like [Capsicum annuum]|uniref:secreted RxLR effector protein 161-like n=1 Tax=Capsicum annuum TaxID=4072 RepID=UPI001FB0F55B|nr:secreted RxLR effector protein 161-like [Capsicum annuum]